MTANLENERNILGSILIKPSLLHEELVNIDARYFSTRGHRHIYNACSLLNKENNPIDIVTVSSLLNEQGLIEEIGGRSYINDLALDIVTTSNVSYHAKILEKNYQLRTIAKTATEVIGKAEAGGNPDELIADFMSAMYSIALKEEEDRFVVADNAYVVSERIRAAETDPDVAEVFNLGFKDADEIIGGVLRGDTVIIAAHTSVGKSAFAACVALNADEQDLPVHIFSLEMNAKKEYMNRMMAIKSEIKLNKFKTLTGFTDSEKQDIAKLEEYFFTRFKCTIFDRPRVDTDYIRAKLITEKKRLGRLGIVIIDHIHLMKGKGMNPKERLSQIAEDLKIIARELDCYMIELCQLKRTSYLDLKSGETKVPKPTLNDLKESGDIENAGNIIILLHREGENAVLTEANIAKNRDGARRACYLNFRGDITKFTNSQKKSL